MLEMDAVALEIDVVERKGRVVEPPNEFTSIPFMLDMKEAPVDKLLVEIDADVVIPELLIVVAFTVAAVVVPVIDKDPTPAEITKYTNDLRKAQMANPSKTVYDGTGKSMTTGGGCRLASESSKKRPKSSS